MLHTVWERKSLCHRLLKDSNKNKQIRAKDFNNN